MEPSVTVKSASGSAAIVFSNPVRDAYGQCHCDVSLSGRYSGVGHLCFHPGESCLVTFLLGAHYDPPRYRDDRCFHGKGSNVTFGIGKHDDRHIGLTAYISSREEFAGRSSIYWRVEATLVVTPEHMRRLADDLSVFFGYETSG